VFTRDELLSLPLDVKKVFGVFAAKHTFNDLTEEELADVRLPLYNADVPTIAEMTQATLKLFEHQKRRFLIVAEEEGSDNFANHNNASGAIEALRRADEAIGVARRYVETHPRVLLVTAADSDAGSMGIWSFDDLSKVADPLPAATDTGGALDGQEGTATPPFLSAPDASGRRLPFGIAWSGSEDMSGTVIARAHGFNAGYLGVNVDNTDIYRLMYRTLFGALPD
jgi:alkaline phosphatase